MPSYADLLDPVIALGHRAAMAILQVYHTEFAVAQKDDQSPVTKADLAAHNVIVDGLRELTPDIPVLSEESAVISYSVRKTWDRYWLVDPLDGTKEFVKRNGEFSVNIALIVDQKTRLGVVQIPVRGDVYFAAHGQGAWFADGGRNRRRIQVRQADRIPVVACSRSHPGRRLRAYLDRLGDHQLASRGSSLKSCMVAQGIADIYVRFGSTSEWDTAAAQCIVEEAGGAVTDMTMRPLRYNTRDSLLNPEFFVFGDASRDWSQYLG